MLSRAVALLLVVLLAASPLAADESLDARLRGRIKQWLEDLRADDFETRETARRELKRHGTKARDLLEAAKDDEDPEVRRTVRTILARTGTRPRTPPPVQIRDGRFDDVHLVTLSVQDATLEAAFKALGERIGARFTVPPSKRTATVSIDVKAQPAFAVLRELLEKGGLRMPRAFDRTGAATLVVADDTPRPPWAASGPVQAEVMEVTSTRPLNAKAPPRYMLNLRVQWIPIVQIAQYQTPRIDKARDAQGNAFVAGAAMARRTSYGVGTTRRYADVQIHLTPSSTKCGDVLEVLELTLPIAGLQHDVREVVLADVSRIPVCLGRDGKEARPGTPESVLFESFAESEDRRGQWVADLAATLVGDVAQRTIQATVEQEDGRVHGLYVAGGRSRAADGTVQLTARAYGIGASKPKSLHVSWFRREESGAVSIKLTNVPLR